MDEDKRKAAVKKVKRDLANLETKHEQMLKRPERQMWLEKVRGKTPKKPVQEAETEDVKEEEKKEKGFKPDALEPGITYILYEERPAKSVELFMAEVQMNRMGLYITRTNPETVREKYHMDEVKICWLTSVKPADDVDSISGLQELSIRVGAHIDQYPKGVILFDGIEYLISNNEFNIVLRLIQQVRDKISTSEANLIIPVNSKAVEEKNLILLERECEKLE